MNKSILSLGAASLLLAASTAYLALQVSHERERLGQDIPAAAAADIVQANGLPNASTAGAADKPDAPRPPDGATESATQTAGAPVKAYKRPSSEVYRQISEQELAASAADPELRRELIQERIPMIRDQYLLLQRRLKVDAERWQRFMEVMAEQELGIMAALADCRKTTNCESVSIDADMAARNKLAVTEILGDSGAAAVEKFRMSGMQRMSLQTMEAELPENQKLPEEQAEELIDALTQVHMDAEKAMEKRQANVGRYFNQVGLLIYDKDLATPEERLADAANYSKKLRARAAKYLRGPQMAAFDRQQDRLLESFRGTQVKAVPPG